MHLGDRRGLLCDCCGRHLKLVEKYEIAYRRYLYDETLSIVKSTTTSTQLAYDLCEDCFEKIDKYLASRNAIRPFHNPKSLLEQKYQKRVSEMKKILKDRQSS